MSNINSTRVTTGKVRFSFVNVFEPRAFGDNTTEKYSVMLMIPKTDIKTLNACNAAIAAAVEKGKSSCFAGKAPAVIKSTLKDADVDTNRDGEVFGDKWPETKGHYIINVSSKTRPQIVNGELQPILNPTEFYSGCYGRASINFFPYNNNGNKGISAGLNNLQKLEDGESLGGITSAEQDFADK